jgi:hypothetical protein
VVTHIEGETKAEVDRKWVRKILGPKREEIMTVAKTP